MEQEVRQVLIPPLNEVDDLIIGLFTSTVVGSDDWLKLVEFATNFLRNNGPFKEWSAYVQCWRDAFKHYMLRIIKQKGLFLALQLHLNDLHESVLGPLRTQPGYHEIRELFILIHAIDFDICPTPPDPAY